MYLHKQIQIAQIQSNLRPKNAETKMKSTIKDVIWNISAFKCLQTMSILLYILSSVALTLFQMFFKQRWKRRARKKVSVLTKLYVDTHFKHCHIT